MLFSPSFTTPSTRGLSTEVYVRQLFVVVLGLICFLEIQISCFFPSSVQVGRLRYSHSHLRGSIRTTSSTRIRKVYMVFYTYHKSYTSDYVSYIITYPILLGLDLVVAVSF